MLPVNMKPLHQNEKVRPTSLPSDRFYTYNRVMPTIMMMTMIEKQQQQQQ